LGYFITVFQDETVRCFTMIHVYLYTMGKIASRILIVDDDPDVVNAARVVLRQRIEIVDTETNPERIKNLLHQNRYDVILLDMNFSAGKMSGNEGLFWLRTIRDLQPEQQVLMITAYGEIKLAVDAMKLGAIDFIVKPWENEKLEASVIAAINHARANRELKQLKTKHTNLSRISSVSDTEVIGCSSTFNEILKSVDKIASTDANVLLLGENGTGKELIAKLIHQKSNRRDQPFIKVDVGSLASGIFESELFGHKKGSFTDAREDRIGRIELATGGTLFIDEIGNLPLALQTKLLSVLQNREVIPLGGSSAVSVDIRLITATNLDIQQAIHQGLFREDLYYRINTVEITLPALRNRLEDIELLANHFLAMYTLKYRKDNKRFSADAIQALEKHSWPGNIRELQHSIERAVIMSEENLITKNDFILSGKKTSGKREILSLEDMERDAIIKAIEKHNGNISNVAKELGLGRTTLYRKMAKFGLDKHS
jgi:two-component system, NtrC family, response regulator HydG